MNNKAKKFELKSIDDFEDVKKIKEKISSFEADIKSMEESLINFPDKVSPEKDTLRKLRIQFDLGECDSKEVSKQIKKVEELTKTQNDAKRELQESLSIKSEGLEVLRSRLIEARENSLKSLLDYASKYVAEVKESSLAEIHAALSTIKNYNEALKFLGAHQGNRFQTLYTNFVPEALATINILIAEEDHKFENVNEKKYFPKVKMYYDSI